MKNDCDKMKGNTTALWRTRDCDAIRKLFSQLLSRRSCQTCCQRCSNIYSEFELTANRADSWAASSAATSLVRVRERPRSLRKWSPPTTILSGLTRIRPSTTSSRRSSWDRSRTCNWSSWNSCAWAFLMQHRLFSGFHRKKKTIQWQIMEWITSSHSYFES